MEGSRLLQAFAPTEVLSFQKLNADAACDDVSISKRNLGALLARAVMVTRLPSPVDEIIDSAIKTWAIFRKNGAESPRGSSTKRARALTLREHAVAGIFPSRKPLFDKAALCPIPTAAKPPFTQPETADHPPSHGVGGLVEPRLAALVRR